MDEGLLTRIILIYLQKTCDTINNETLLRKLETIGFSDKCIRWFWSYLSERIFFIETENQISDYGKVSLSVPQGSILGLLLFLVYFNDMPQAAKSNLFLYANILCTNIEMSKIEKQLNKDFENVCDGSLTINKAYTLLVFWMKLRLPNPCLKSIKWNKWEAEISLPEKQIYNTNTGQDAMQCYYPASFSSYLFCMVP